MDVNDYSNDGLSNEVILNGSFLTVASPPPSIIKTSYNQKLIPVKPNSLLKEKLLSTSNPTNSSEIPVLFDESSQHAEASLSGFQNQFDGIIQQTSNSNGSIPIEENAISLHNEASDEQSAEAIDIAVQDDSNLTPLAGGSMLQFIDNTGQNRIVYIPAGSTADQAVASSSIDSAQLGNALLNSNTYLLGPNDHAYPVIQENSGSEVIVTNSQSQVDLPDQGTTALTLQFPTPDNGTISLPPPETQQTVQTSPATNVKKRKHGGGWRKGRKRTVNKHQIKSPNTAYVLFGKERRKQIAAEIPGIGLAEITRKVGKEWNEIDAETKTKYLEKADREMERFKQEVLQFQQTDQYKTILEQRTTEKLKTLETMTDDPTKKNLKRILEIDDPDILYCKVCDQFFSNTHNKNEHMTGKSHLRKLNDEMVELDKKYEEKTNQVLALEPDHNMQMTDFIEQFIAKNSERELELETLRTNLDLLKKSHTSLNKQLQTLKDSEVKLKQEIETMKQWSGQIMLCIDNLKMVPILFGVINF